MASPRKTIFATVAVLALGATGYFLYSAFAVQGQGTLAQAPLNIQSSVTPAFMMAVDDSGSMTFQTQFPGADGAGCWSNRSFFDSDNKLRTSGTCRYNHVTPGPRIDEGRWGVPPLDAYGFARSPQFNPAYFNPEVKYEAWIGLGPDKTLVPYAEAATDKTKIDPRYDPTVALFEDRESREGQDRFRIQSGMVLPKGTVYSNCRSWNGTRDRCDNEDYRDWRTADSDIAWESGSQFIYIKYYPATFYLRSADSGGSDKLLTDYGYTEAEREKVYNACGTGCNMWRYRITNDAGTKNFANWFSFYGNRNRAMVAGMTRSLVEVTNMRVGYFTINQHRSFDEPLTPKEPDEPDEKVTMYDMANTDDRVGLFTKLLALPANGSTPNRQAVSAANQQFLRTDVEAPVKLVCQKNAVMLFTDGYSNQDGPTVGNVDSGMKAPFSDSHSNTMADIVTQYYLDKDSKSPIRPDLTAGKVTVPEAACKATTPAPNLDCQVNLHTNFYGVTLGARGNLYNPDLVQDAYTTPAVYENWPSRQDDNPTTVDDIWHAATNTRGEYVNARTPVEIVAAMRRILQQVGGGATPSGSIALTGSRIGSGSLTVVPFYESLNNGTDWYSTLTGAEVTSNIATGAVTYKTKWEASTELPAAAARNIWFATTSAGAKPTVAKFLTANLGAKPIDTLCSNKLLGRCDETKAALKMPGATAEQMVAYLRGDDSLEIRKTGGKFRDRAKSRLGDIVNSSPVVSSPIIDDYGYVSLRGTTATDFNPYDYDDYMAKKKTQNRVPMVYAGANDGMLHAFNGVSGVEEFAYIPATAVGHMGNLLFPYLTGDKNDQVFSHRYYVDGLITVSDAHYDGAWQTVLVGAAGAGGRGVFALDVSDPDSFDDGDVLWEINDKVDDAAVKNNIGYVLGKPVVVPVKVGTTVKWKAIFGNGYGSVNGKATLFVVDIEDGTVELKQAIETTAGLPSSNGLGNIIAIDRWQGSTDTGGRDGYADTVYGGDQNGAVWKFDLREGTPTVEVDGKPLFIAADAAGKRQPILGGFEAASGPGGGVMLYFGTGSFSFENDPSDKTIQSLYGVLDTFKDVAITGRGQLVKQDITADASGVRTTTKATGLGKFGWYMDLGVVDGSGDLVVEGERFVGYPVIASGIVFFPTYDPDSKVDCTSSGNNWLYGLNALTGAAALNGVQVGAPGSAGYGEGSGAVKLNTDGSAPIKDVAVMTTPRQGILPVGTTDPDVIKKALDAKCSMVVQAAGADPLYVPRPCGRQSWRQVL